MKHFTIKELSRSEKAVELGIDNTPGPQETANLTALVDNLLDPIREAWGRPIIVNSGYRCPQLNSALKGSPRSEHLYGRAADITAGSKEMNRQLFVLIQNYSLRWRQLIDEYGYAWIHISYNPADNKKQILHLG